MTRSILAALAATFAVSVLTGTGCASTGIGDPCIPEQEYRPDFLGFSVNEVSVESKSFQCQTRLCLVNHFQGRVSCPYGQTPAGTNKNLTKACTNISNVPSAGCCTPGISQAVTGPLDANGMPTDTKNKEQVLGQCTLRKADTAVYCSCRCQNINGQTNDGANYCTCPDGFSCQQLVTSIGAGDQGLTGAYCVKNNTQYDPNVGCGGECSPTTHTCGTQQLP
ncbi:MAG: hypothetical protein M3O46_02950 [Myxococcota bacterium]|nr:hypothetical protein [Myxococcota bacterium]